MYIYDRVHVKVKHEQGFALVGQATVTSMDDDTRGWKVSGFCRFVGWKVTVL